MERDRGDGITERRETKKVRVQRMVGDPTQEMAAICRRRVSNENRQEFDNEKRAKELSRRGYDPGQIGAMMQVSSREAEKMIQHKTDGRKGPNMVLDGNL